jgi:hypothetical protein
MDKNKSSDVYNGLNENKTFRQIKPFTPYKKKFVCVQNRRNVIVTETNRFGQCKLSVDSLKHCNGDFDTSVDMKDSNVKQYTTPNNLSDICENTFDLEQMVIDKDKCTYSKEYKSTNRLYVMAQICVATMVTPSTKIQVEKFMDEPVDLISIDENMGVSVYYRASYFYFFTKKIKRRLYECFKLKKLNNIVDTDADVDEIDSIVDESVNILFGDRFCEFDKMSSYGNMKDDIMKSYHYVKNNFSDDELEKHVVKIQIMFSQLNKRFM